MFADTRSPKSVAIAMLLALLTLAISMPSSVYSSNSQCGCQNQAKALVTVQTTASNAHGCCSKTASASCCSGEAQGSCCGQVESSCQCGANCKCSVQPQPEQQDVPATPAPESVQGLILVLISHTLSWTTLPDGIRCSDQVPAEVSSDLALTSQETCVRLSRFTC